MNGVDNFARRIFPVVAMALLVLTGLPELGHGQAKGVDAQADKLLRRMSDYLAGRQQFSFKAESTLEAVLTSGQKLQYDSPATLIGVAAQQAARPSQGRPRQPGVFLRRQDPDALQPARELVRDDRGTGDTR